MATQGFININNDPYVYQETSAGQSIAIGVETSLSPEAWGIWTSPTTNVTTAGPNNINIQLSTNGNLALAANGTGNIILGSVIGATSANPTYMTIDTVTGVLSNASIPATGVTSISGTASEITASASTGSVTLSIPIGFVAPGSVTSTTSVIAGNSLSVNAGTITFTPLSTAGLVVNSSSGVISTYATTNHALNVGNAGGQLTALSVGATNTVLLGNTGANPSFGTVPNAALTSSSVTLSNGNNITVTGSPLSLGGTASFNLTGTTQYAVQVGSATGSLSSLPLGTSGFVLTSGGAGTNPSWIAPATSGTVTSVSGTALQISVATGTTTPVISLPSAITAPGSLTTTTFLASGTVVTAATNLVSTAGNLLLPTTSSTAGQLQINAVRFAHTFGDSTNQTNTWVGSQSGNFTMTNATAQQNSGFGYKSGSGLTTGAYNVFFGPSTGYQITSGSRNILIGYNSGSNYTTSESNNIQLGYNTTGTVSESNVLRIGNGTGSSDGNLNKAFISGIYNTSVGATAGVAIVDSTDQHGTISGASGTVLVGGTKPSWSALSGLAATSISGTTSEITASASTGSVTLSTPAVFIAPGSSAAVTTVTAGTNIVSTNGNLLLPTTSATQGQIQINSVPVFHTFGTQNVFGGTGAGNFTLTAGSTVQQTAFGYHALQSLTVGAPENAAFGYNSLAALTTGEYNAAFGSNSGTQLVSGTFNLLAGRTGGYNYTTSESSNICLNHQGIIGESNVLRIGAATGTSAQNLNKAFICGVYNIGVGATAGVAIVDSTDQHGTISGASGTVLVGGTKPSWSALSGLAATSISGTASEITASASTGSVTLSTPAVFIAPGSSAAVTTVTAGTDLVSTNGDLVLPITSSTVGSIIIGGVNALNMYGGATNWFAGGAGNFTMTSIQTVAIGNLSGHSLTSGRQNVYIGYQSGASDAGSGGGSVGVGANTLGSYTGAVHSGNVAIGNSALTSLLTGSQNVAIGYAVGSAYVGNEQFNILIGNGVSGVAAEANIIRIGASSGASQPNAAYIQGIQNVTVSNGIHVVINPATGQLGTNLIQVNTSIVANTGNINTTETIVVQTANAMPANSMQVGDTFRITLVGNTVVTSVASASTFRVRVGTSGTTADTAMVTGTVTSAVGTSYGRVELLFTVRTVGASSTQAGIITTLADGIGISATDTTVTQLTTNAINTTTANFMTVTYQSAATTTTTNFLVAFIEKI